MTLDLHAFPFSTPYDHTEDPPGSIDPLGTLPYSETLADILLPGFTARMWRPRLLTFSTVTSLIGYQVVKLTHKEEMRIETCLAFERLFVTSVMLLEKTDPEGFPDARRRLPGSRLARSALINCEPLTTMNFLKGQSVNGPFGVMARLARSLELIDEDGELRRYAHDLLLAWSEEQGLFGVLDEDNSSNKDNREGAQWVYDVTKTVLGIVERRTWPSRGQNIWPKLSGRLRPDEAGRKEKQLLIKILKSEPTRCRILQLLSQRKVLDVFRRQNSNRSRGGIERNVLQNGIHVMLANDPLDMVIGITLKTIEIYEQAAMLFQNTFDRLVWSLKQREGQGIPDDIIGDTRVQTTVKKIFKGLPKVIRDLEQNLNDLSKEPALDKTDILEPLSKILEDVKSGSSNVPKWVDATLGRHERVQKQKHKGAWIERRNRWYLLPGFGINQDEPQKEDDGYLHPYRIMNAYSFLSDLGLVRLERMTDEEN